MNNKKIVFITGTRADFGKLKSLIKISEQDYDVRVFITGMHLLEKYGSTYNEVLKEGFSNSYLFMNQAENTKMEIAFSNTINGFSNYVSETKTDLIIVNGDRLEALAAATVGAFNNIRVAHIEGGEVSGTIDESIRHAISKFSHFHFVANEDAKQRLISMGECRESIEIIGSPDIDIMLSGNLPSIDEVKERYEITYSNYAIFMFHPVTTEIDSLSKKINLIVDALIKSGKNYVVVYPNNDLGSDIILDAYKKLKHNSKFRIIPSFKFEYFLTLLKHAAFIVGNSSAGIREAEVYSIPTINIGTRQDGRSISKSIINVSENVDEILSSLDKIENIKSEQNNSFGSGESDKLFLTILNKGDLFNLPIQKKFVSDSM